ncbi:hypothetical protein FLCH110379_10400 [Flavobacterium chungbukense]|uniref:4Fe-4S ferredoxin-type domain-containing protein n=1 Tax=Flavobacterium chungbukense TaxID=877464 RepID=A0ABP7XM08_9FLAO
MYEESVFDTMKPYSYNTIGYGYHATYFLCAVPAMSCNLLCPFKENINHFSYRDIIHNEMENPPHTVKYMAGCP